MRQTEQPRRAGRRLEVLVPRVCRMWTGILRDKKRCATQRDRVGDGICRAGTRFFMKPVPIMTTAQQNMRAGIIRHGLLISRVLVEWER